MSRIYETNESGEKDEDESIITGIVPHLSELRFRLIFLISAILILTVTAFWFSDRMIDYLTGRFLDANKIVLYFFDLAEPFTFRLRLSFTAALFASVPLILFHAWRFVKPAFKENEARYGFPVLLCSILLFYAGSVLSFNFALPQSIRLLLQFLPANMTSSINAGSFLSFITCFVFFSGIIFELPVASFILARLGIIDHKTLNSKRKIAIVAIWIVAAVITPPDVISQTMAALPMMLLYEISVVVAFFARRR